MKLIIGLGNPGEPYKFTRHNIGFLVLEDLARKHNIKFKINKRFKASMGEGVITGEAMCLVMPQTFMNLSGHSVRPILNWFKISPCDMLVVMDDAALPFGTIRLRPKGSSAGHKGMESIIDLISTQEFPRIRVGIMVGKNIKNLSSYVLDRFNKREQKKLTALLNIASLACECWVKEGIISAMNKFNKPGGL